VVFGPLADQFSVEALLVLAGILLVAVLAAILAFPAARRSLAQVDEPPADPAAAVDAADAVPQDTVGTP
ncbi:MAG TPA: MFS transporter, partial [Promicromonospora sp.]|nr:MFS transporter [Promicromonospora sp.]